MGPQLGSIIHQGTRQGWEPKFRPHEQPSQWNPTHSLQHQLNQLLVPFPSLGLQPACTVWGVHGDPERLPGCRNGGGSVGYIWKRLIVLPSQSHKYKHASVSPSQSLLNVFTRAPLSVPFCYYKAFIFDACSTQKDICLSFPTTLLSSYAEELVNKSPQTSRKEAHIIGPRGITLLHCARLCRMKQ